jgi:hypothetical protein
MASCVTFSTVWAQRTLLLTCITVEPDSAGSAGSAAPDKSLCRARPRDWQASTFQPCTPGPRPHIETHDEANLRLGCRRYRTILSNSLLRNGVFRPLFVHNYPPKNSNLSDKTLLMVAILTNFDSVSTALSDADGRRCGWRGWSLNEHGSKPEPEKRKRTIC